MSENILYREPADFEDITDQERKNLAVVMEELKGWDTQDLERVISVMAADIIYHDMTLPPAKGHKGLREFGEGWLVSVPDFSVFIEKFIIQGVTVVNMGSISGTIVREYFGLPATNKKFDCMFCQVAVVKDGKIQYIRDHWDYQTMAKQVGWINE